MSSRPTRRTFLKTSAAAGAAVSMAGILTSASVARAKTLKLDPAEGTVTFKLEDAKDLAEVGGATKVKINGHEKVVCVRTAEDTFVTVSIKCTHEGCNVKWEKEKTMFQCPCHESAFGTDGKPNGGPANEPLLVYPTALADGIVTITIPEGAPVAEKK